MSKIKILVAEDEAAIREFILINLNRSGYEVVEAFDGQDAYEKYLAESDSIGIAVLDIMMPRMDGLELCKKLRSINNNLGIVMLTARTEEIDKILGLELGADDYVTKPFSVRELMARVKANLRRTVVKENVPDTAENTITIGEITINTASYELRKSGKPIF